MVPSRRRSDNPKQAKKATIFRSVREFYDYDYGESKTENDPAKELNFEQKETKSALRGRLEAKRTFDKYPSAYANLAASKYYKDPNYAKEIQSEIEKLGRRSNE